MKLFGSVSFYKSLLGWYLNVQNTYIKTYLEDDYHYSHITT